MIVDAHVIVDVLVNVIGHVIVIVDVIVDVDVDGAGSYDPVQYLIRPVSLWTNCEWG